MFVLEGAALQRMGKLVIKNGPRSSRLSSLFLSCALLGAAAGCAKGSGARRNVQQGGEDAGQDHTDAAVDDDARTPESDAGAGEDAATDSSVEVSSDSGVTLGFESRDAYCAGEGSPVEIRVPGTADGGVTEQVCTTGLASRIFQFGICSCRDLDLPGAFAIDAFDSDLPDDHNKSGASIGTNGAFTTSGSLRVRGSLVASGSGKLGVSGTDVQIDGNVRTNAKLDVAGASISFRRDLWVNGDIAVAGLVSVRGDVYQTPGHTLSPELTIGGSAKSQVFVVPDPCACAEDQIVDIAAIVADGRAHNHNADLGLPQDATLNMQGTGGVTLDCGRFIFGSSSISGSGNTIHATGRTAVFVDGDLEIAGDFGVDVGSEGELDIFVSGNLKLSGAGTVGSVARPAALRFYVAGSEAIQIKGALVFAANVYAPRALVEIGGADDIYGALFAADVEISGAHEMHYDRAIMTSDGGEKCEPPTPPPPTPPTPPEEPGCKGDLDCDPALVCESGSCTPVLELL